MCALSLFLEREYVAHVREGPQERGLDNFITALMNQVRLFQAVGDKRESLTHWYEEQAQANQEGPRRAPEEMINSLPRKHLSADDIGMLIFVLVLIQC